MGTLLGGLLGLAEGQGATGRLEKELRGRFGVKHVFLVSSGKAALATILGALSSLRPGRDEAIIPAYTCYSVPSAIVKAGLKVRPCDINSQTFDFNLALLEKTASAKTLCIIPDHLFGIPADLEAIRAVCKKTGAYLVEDAAQAMGAKYKNGYAGAFGDVGFFSFGRGKNITCGTGGAILTDSDEIADAIRKTYGSVPFPGLGKDALELAQMALMTVLIRPWLFWLPSALPFLRLGETIFHKDFPIKRLSGLQAGFLRGWEEVLEKANRVRKENSTRLIKGLGECLDMPLLRYPVPFLRFPVLAESKGMRDEILKAGREKGLGVSAMYPAPVNEIPELRDEMKGTSFPDAKAVSERLLALPTHHLLRQKDIERICGLFREGGPMEKRVSGLDERKAREASMKTKGAR